MNRLSLPLVFIALCVLVGASSAAEMLGGVPGELHADPATLNALAFRWFLEGDDDGDATGDVSYRKAGDDDWRGALPMLRINREVIPRKPNPFRCGNLFAGSVMNLDPGTDYEVRFQLADPDGPPPSSC